MNTEEKAKKVTMRHQWFEHVRKTRKKLSKGLEKQVAHREAMRKASASWGKQKEKLIRKAKREAKLKKFKETQKCVS